jgi:hypothetical protein
MPPASPQISKTITSYEQNERGVGAAYYSSALHGQFLRFLFPLELIAHQSLPYPAYLYHYPRMHKITKLLRP